MSENTVSTDQQNVQTELDRLKWEIRQHKETEMRAYKILSFVRTAMGEPYEDRDITLNDDSREGLAQVLHFAASLLLEANATGPDSPHFYKDDPDMCSFFRQVKYPNNINDWPEIG